MEETNVSVVQSSSEFSQEKGNIEKNQVEVEEIFSSPTPAKTREPSRTQSKLEKVDLPEKYVNLLDFFNRMTSSLRLLKLRKKLPTFQNISTQVEILTKRKFLYKHLAQMKYILPEAIQIDKILVHDQKTLCMVPDMKVALALDTVEDHNEDTVFDGFVALSNRFTSRLKEFYTSNAEDSDVPEAILPDPFNQRNIMIKGEPMPQDLIPQDLSSSWETERLNPSHFSPSFKRRFYQRAIAAETEQSELPSHIKPVIVANKDIEKASTFHDSSSETVKYESTPIKLPPKSGSIIIKTPVPSTPMISSSANSSVLTCEDDKKSTANRIQQSTSTAKKSLDFCMVDDKDTSISHNKNSARLSDLVILIHQIFKSVKFCPITKQELVHKIIMHDLNIDEQSEVETQIEHLEKLVPDWFFKELTLSGDFLYNVKKVLDPNSICERISVM